MLEDLKDKLNNSIEKMKQLLPEKFRGKSQEDEYEDGEEYEEYEEDEVEEGLASADDEKTAQHDISQLEGDEEETEDDEEDEEEGEEEEELSDEEKKKKQKQLIIRIVAGVLVVYLIADEFLLKSPEEEVAVPTQVQRPKKKPKPVEQEKPSEPIAEPVVQEEIKIPDVSTEPKEEVEKVEVVEDKKEDAPVDLELTPKEVEEVKSEDEVVESEKVEEVSPVVGESEVKEVAPTEKGATNLEDKLSEITEELENKEKEILEYTPAPNYEDYGKGLVYNCKDKHWACVDRKPYLQCEMNYKWSKQNGKTPECSIEKTYADFKSCRIVQIHYINTIKEAPDCQ